MTELKHPKITLETIEQIMGMITDQTQETDFAWELSQAKQGNQNTRITEGEDFVRLFFYRNRTFIGYSVDHGFNEDLASVYLSETEIINLIGQCLMALMELRAKE